MTLGPLTPLPTPCSPRAPLSKDLLLLNQLLISMRNDAALDCAFIISFCFAMPIGEKKRLSRTIDFDGSYVQY